MIGNLLSLAMGVVGYQQVQWAKFQSRATNSVGHKVSTYDPPTNIIGNVQPVPQRLYEQLGLDFNKRYVFFYTPADVVSVERDGAGDCITYGGRTYLCESDTPWKTQAGWVQVLCVGIPTP